MPPKNPDRKNKKESGETKSTGANGNKKLDELGVAAVKEVSLVAALVMKGANPVLRIVTFALYGITTIGVLGIIATATAGGDAFKIVLVVAIALFVSLVLIIFRYRELGRSAKESAKDAPSVKAGSPQISPIVFNHILSCLEEARKKVHSYLKDRVPELEDKDVRANIFLPHYKRDGDPSAYVLKIYHGLHLNMSMDDELKITFDPGQGATGNVFRSGQPRATRRLEKDAPETGNLDAEFKITPDLAKSIHPDLMWIMSMPLMVDSQRPVGVMNIDGLRHSVDWDTLYKFMPKLTLDAIGIWSAIVNK